MQTRILLVEDDEDFREAFARMLELELALELDGDGGRIPALPTLVITADLEHSVATRAIEAGARGVLSKMVSVGATAQTVQMLIGAGRSAG